MKITDIKTAQARYSYVRVYTDEGLVGTGECSHCGSGWRKIVEDLKGTFIGKDPLDVDCLFEEARRAHIFRGALAGLFISALTGIEIALWDLAGKAMNVPVYRLLGGKFRDRIRLYVDSAHGGAEDFESYKKTADWVKEQGFTAIKFDLDDGSNPYKLDKWNWSVTPGELETLTERVAMMREAVGSKMDLAVDMHGFYDGYSGLKIACAVEPYNLLWLEEPVPPENIDALLRIKQATQTPLCVGENLYLRYGFRELLEKQAADIIMPDISKCGGLSECRKIANMAEIYYIPMAPHNNSGPLSTLADSHVCASIPNFLALEWHRMGDETWDDVLLTNEPLIQDGYVVLPDTPGLGAELDDDFVQQSSTETPLFQ
ncbi:MAG: mandelate racemase/muconate lactonizing enzyme family protein [Candidatus Poribacteria bacterium]|nr:mandelate racemase/muconate lactonizing enzyme family protein [Candidatus Poribacteria bacterium]